MSGHGRTYYLPDPDHSPDLGTGFTPDFEILAGYLKKLWMDFDEILCVECCGSARFVQVLSRIRLEFGSWNRIYTGFLNFSRIWRSYGRISMKFYASIAVGACTTWLDFEPDPDHTVRILEPDLHRIFKFQRDVWSHGQIWMKFNGSVAAGRIDYVFNWIRVIVRIQEPDLHRIL